MYLYLKYYKFAATSTRSKKATFKCTLCPRFFATTYGLEQHLQRHVEKRPFNCTECGNGFKRITHLKAHVRRIHRKEKRCVCLKCGKGFSENYELLCHQRVHEGNFYWFKVRICSPELIFINITILLILQKIILINAINVLLPIGGFLSCELIRGNTLMKNHTSAEYVENDTLPAVH